MVNEKSRIEGFLVRRALSVGANMQGLITVWRALPVAKRLMLVGAVTATIVAFSFLAKTASSPTMALLYSGLEPSAAGDVVAALEKMSIQTDVRGNAIYVPSNRRDFARMALARDGLPRQGQAGYELLEGLNGFSTNSDIFDVTYWRATEGELARTILATPGV
ncbi:MAG: flagellar M-ring protein FliF, partial [Proteobacteria bacterium]|nr:flagellar M-ring protein FliF [Pseudomonadota bacterium]